MIRRKREAPATVVGHRSHERARIIELDLKVDAGAPLPHVVSNGRTTSVLFFTGLAKDADWDGRTVTVIDPAAEEMHSLGVMTFHGTRATLFGPPNDEALHGHPLWGHGLAFYAFHEVAHSRWLSTYVERNSVHERHSDAAWAALHHYIFTFHDETLEVIAERYSTRRIQVTFSDALHRIVDDIL